MTDVKTSFEQSTQALPTEGKGQLILCDFNGTLSDVSGRKNGLNTDLVTFLIEAEKRGYKVVIHSGKASDNMRDYIYDDFTGVYPRKHPAFKVFMETREIDHNSGLPIFDKNDTDSRKAFLTIDDDYVSHAPHQWAPCDARMYATLKSWGVPIAEAAPSVVPPTPR